MQRPSEQLRRILEELVDTRVEATQKSIHHLKVAHTSLSTFWAAVLRAEQAEAPSRTACAQVRTQLTIWNRHTRLCSVLNEFFRSGTPNNPSPHYVTAVGAHIFTATREAHPQTDTHTVYTFALTPAKVTNDLPQPSTLPQSTTHSS